jgi:hypothetical protein
MFKWLSRLFGGKPAKTPKAAATPRKAAAVELRDAAAEMGKAAAGLRQAAVHMNPAAAEAPSPAPSREEIIRQAMQIRRDKARAIEELPAKERQRLRALAEKMMLGPANETPPPASRPPRRRDH